MPTLEWVGKHKVVNHHHDIPYRVLEHTYGFSNGQVSDTPTDTGNIIIHGDNLEALKSLLPKYEGKIKCIYIDPPYNTGNEGWVYNDNVNDPKIKKRLHQVVGKEGEDLSRHDKRLCMMYPRLKLLHKLLRDDGVIFVSIDDNEQANLKLMMDEVFGFSNHISSIIWQKKKGGGNDSKFIAVEHEYISCYVKNKDQQIDRFLPYQSDYLRRYKEKDEKGFFFRDTFMRASGKQYYPIACPDGTVLEFDKNGHKLSRLRSENRFKEDLLKGEIRIVKIKNQWTVHFKQYLSQGHKPRSIINDTANNSHAKQNLSEIFGQEKIFDYPKPYELIAYLVSMVTDTDSIILDSFAGSGTTAHAVLNLNKQDGGDRKFILVELMDYAETITAERVKRVITGYGEGSKSVEGTGGGFDYFELGEQLFLSDESINPHIGIAKLREYIWYTETRSSTALTTKSDNPYFLGSHNSTDYYFYYTPDRTTTLNFDFLATLVRTSSDQWIIYADICSLDEPFMREHSIIFKKIPRDISRF